MLLHRGAREGLDVGDFGGAIDSDPDLFPSSVLQVQEKIGLGVRGCSFPSSQFAVAGRGWVQHGRLLSGP